MQRTHTSTLNEACTSLAPNMLGAVAACALLLAGCVAQHPGSQFPANGQVRTQQSALDSTERSSPPARDSESIGASRSQNVIDDVTSELGPDAAETLPPSPPPPRPVDAGAAAVVDALIVALERVDASADDPVVIRLASWRNQSHASFEEIAQATQRMAGLLNDSRGRHNVRFTVDDDVPADFAMHATAYLVTDRGFDLWELYLRLTPADGSWTVWSPNGPVRLLRANRAGAPQVYIGPGVLDS